MTLLPVFAKGRPAIGRPVNSIIGAHDALQTLLFFHSSRSSPDAINWLEQAANVAINTPLVPAMALALKYSGGFKFSEPLRDGTAAEYRARGYLGLRTTDDSLPIRTVRQLDQDQLLGRGNEAFRVKCLDDVLHSHFTLSAHLGGNIVTYIHSVVQSTRTENPSSSYEEQCVRAIASASPLTTPSLKVKTVSAIRLTEAA